jgi:hypothetical protein
VIFPSEAAKLESELPGIGLVLAAWFAAASCGLISAWHLRRLLRLAPPTRNEVRARLAAQASAAERAEVVQALREEGSEAERLLSLATLWPRSLARISLASGTALAVTSLAKGLGTSGSRLPGGLLEFSAGFVGMLVCAAFGRQARDLAAKLRQAWRDALRAVSA